MSSVLDSIKKNSDNFSFISTFFDLVGNREFKAAEISVLYSTDDNKQTAIWKSLSAIAELLGETFYSNTLNFIDNICNIDTCKVNLLQSLIRQLGVDYSVVNEFNYMPLEVQNLIDIFSVTREYMTDGTKFDSKLVDMLLSGGEYVDTMIYKQNEICVDNCIYEDANTCSIDLSCNELTKKRQEMLDTDDNLKSYWSTAKVQRKVSLDDSKYYNTMSVVVSALLDKKIRQTYNDKEVTYVYENLSNCILISSFALQNTELEKINRYKLKYNIPVSFNVEDEVDKLENGEILLSDYTSNEQEILSIEIDRRKAAFKNSQLKTRYKYYREKELKEYTEFILNEIAVHDISVNYISSNVYDLDSRYLELYTSTEDTKKLFKKDNITGRITVDENIMQKIVDQVCTITLAIRQVRQQLKTQVLKTFLRGTGLFVKFIISEYLKNNIVDLLKNLDSMDKYVFNLNTTYSDIIEYIDTTEYSNISCVTDFILRNSISADLSSLHDRYWLLQNSYKAVGAIDNTNLFQSLPSIPTENDTFTDENISSFYFNTLNTNLKCCDKDVSLLVKNLNKLLNHIYDAGAENTFISDDIFHTYDSYETLKEYDDLVRIHRNCIRYIQDDFSTISDSIPAEVILIKNNKPIDLKTLISSAAVIYYKIHENAKEVACRNLIDDLSIADELTTCIPLSNMIPELCDKYAIQEQAKYDMHMLALSTDSYAAQCTYDTTEDKHIRDYYAISASYESVSAYIQDGISKTDTSLSILLNALCISLSSIEDEQERNNAVKNTLTLSNNIKNAGELSSNIELVNIRETLSSQYELHLASLMNELCAIRSTDLFKYRQAIYDKYSGSDNANYQYLNLENRRHPSFMLHPYMKNYAEKTSNSYLIPNVANTDIDSELQSIKDVLDDYIDDDGYLLSVWRNPLNSNTDYVSRYEDTNKFVNGKEYEIIGFDGLFFPEAVHDLLTNKSYEYILSDHNMSAEIKNEEITALTGNFILSLSGYEVINLDTNSKQNISWNPWYEHLDLTKQQRSHIAEQLTMFSADISVIATYEKDIFRYGLDIYKNAYCLLKDTTYINDYSILMNLPGQLWMRIKDHPIAFPAYALSATQTYSLYSPYYGGFELLSTSLISYDKNKSNPEFKTLDIVVPFSQNTSSSSPKYCIPNMTDFTFAFDRNIIVMNGKLSTYHREDLPNAPYPIIAKISLNYNYDNDCNEYFHDTIGALGSRIYSIISEDDLRNSLSSWSFGTYFADSSKVGTVYYKTDIVLVNDSELSNTSISIYAGYYDMFNKQNSRKELKPLCIDTLLNQVHELENVCMDSNGTNVTIAYLEDLPSKLSNYVNTEVVISDMAAAYVSGDIFKEDYFDQAVKIQNFNIDYEFIKLSEKSYVKYTDIGCFGLSGIDNKLGNTYIGKYDIQERGVYMFLLMSQPISCISNMIDFEYTLPIRPYENYKNKTKLITTPQGTKFQVMDFLCAHYFEPAIEPTTSSDLANYKSLSSVTNIFDIYELKKCFKQYKPLIKVDEDFFLSASRVENTFDSYIDYPYLYIPDNSTSPYILEKYAMPYGITEVSDDNCVFSIHDGDNASKISASWCRWTDENNLHHILLDFNSMFNNINNDHLSVNAFNNLHLFLNLGKEGDAGILNLYANPTDVLNGTFDYLGHVYIKNISDDKPKFILSASTDINVDYTYIIAEQPESGQDLSIVCENRITTYLVAELQKVIKM